MVWGLPVGRRCRRSKRGRDRAKYGRIRSPLKVRVVEAFRAGGDVKRLAAAQVQPAAVPAKQVPFAA